MFNRKYLMLGVLLVSLMFVGYQCSSTEITSARLYISQKNYDKAIEALNKEIAKNPKADEAYFLKGEIYMAQEKYDQVVENYNKSLEASKKFEADIKKRKTDLYALLYNRGLAFIQKASKSTNQDTITTSYSKALVNLKDAYKVQPDSFNALFYYTKLSYQLKNFDEPAALIENHYKNHKEAGITHLFGENLIIKHENLLEKYKSSKNAADSIESYKNLNAALTVLEEGFKQYPNNTDIASYLSNVYIKTGNKEKAKDIYQTLITKDPNNKIYHYNYGVVLLNSGNYPDAISEFKKAIEIDKNYKDAYFNIGTSYLKWGVEINNSLAESKNPDFTERNEKYKNAVTTIEELVALEPANQQYLELLAKAYTFAGETKKAEEVYNQLKK